MPRRLIAVSIFLGVLSACRVVTPVPLTPTLQPPTATITQIPTATYTAIPPTPSVVTPSPTESPSPTLALSFEVRTHPDDGLYVGDQVSFEVLPPSNLRVEKAIIQIFEPGNAVEPLEAQFTPYGLAGRMQATQYWSWDTTGLEAGVQPLTFTIPSLAYTWTYTVTLEAAAEVPPPEPRAHWATRESDCCLFYYISDTAAAREITATMALADQRAAHAVETMGINFTEPLVVTLLPRVLGQGGFASGEMYLSFLDRNYAGNNLEMVLHHEMIHVLDQRLGGDLRPSMLVEGLAVYLTGGHYKPEKMIPRAAALLAPAERADLLGLDWYIPLEVLVDDFYQSQHEIGYIEAGALVEYMVESWGWEAFSDFYRDIHPIEAGTQSQAIEAALQSHFDLTLENLENDFVTMLTEQTITPEIMADVRLTVSFFEVMRRYQLALDPSAHFLTAWLPDGPMMRERGIVADLVRRPSAMGNLALETLLVTADEAMEQGDVQTAAQALEAVTAVLDAMAAGQTTPFEAHALAQAYFEIARQTWETGYQVEHITVLAGSAQAVASQGWPDLRVFDYRLAEGDWVLAGNP